MSALETPSPNFSDDALRRIAETCFGKAGDLKSLVSDRDQNVRLSTGGDAWVLKVANAGEDPASIDFQNAMLLHLEATAPDLPVPRLVRTRDGAYIAEHTENGAVYKIRMLSYLRGRPLAETERSPELLEDLGALMGRVSAALQSFSHPAAYRPDFLWALDNAPACESYLTDIADVENRALVERVFARYRSNVAPRIQSLRKSVTHQDANDYNLLVEDGPPAKISGLIDFGDACLGAQINELAVTLAYALMGVDDIPAAAGAVIRGYASAFPLQREEIDVLYDLVAMRLAVSVAISSHRSKAHPENEYLLVSQKPAFELLRRLEALNKTPYARALFADAALVGTSQGEETHTEENAIEAIAARRRQALNPALSVSYRKPLYIVKGRGPYLYDARGVRYLDGVNNIAHVGHSHPHVVAAAARQAGLLNTNTRYLHRTILDFADRIAASLPGDLSVVTFVNSGTEANELALRMARTATGRRETIVLDWAYHGNSSATVEVSPYKFKRAGGFAKPEDVEIAELPDPYRGRYKGSGAETGAAYADSVKACVERIMARAGHGPACFIAESISGVGGQIVFPEGYLQSAYAHVRAAGGLCIADEVQCGFGRVGDAFWGFEEQGVVPDIVVLGKPIGAGHPLAAVVTTPEIARGFANGMEYFNSFGGNPVSMATGMAVMDVLEGEGLQENARIVGKHLLVRFAEMAERFEAIGDVRGRGLFLGIELVKDRETRTPAPELAADIVNGLRERGVLLSTDGPDDNVLKFKPPMVFRDREATFLCDALEKTFAEYA